MGPAGSVAGRPLLRPASVAPEAMTSVDGAMVGAVVVVAEALMIVSRVVVAAFKS